MQYAEACLFITPKGRELLFFEQKKILTSMGVYEEMSMLCRTELVRLFDIIQIDLNGVREDMLIKYMHAMNITGLPSE